MENKIEQIRSEIRRNGFLSGIQINTRFFEEGLDFIKLLKLLECEDIKRVEYTNTYVLPQKVKDLFYYNPNNTKKRVKRKKS